jgi:hypothetical protein
MRLKKKKQARKSKPRKSTERAKRITSKKLTLPPVPRKRFAGYGETFLTEREIEACQTMLRTNSVKATCSMMNISRPRYSQLTQSVIRKWKMAVKTSQMGRSFYQKAKSQNNLLARHLTEVKRVEIFEPEVSQPMKVETIETVESV